MRISLSLSPRYTCNADISATQAILTCNDASIIPESGYWNFIPYKYEYFIEKIFAQNVAHCICAFGTIICQFNLTFDVVQIFVELDIILRFFLLSFSSLSTRNQCQYQPRGVVEFSLQRLTNLLPSSFQFSIYSNP